MNKKKIKIASSILLLILLVIFVMNFMQVEKGLQLTSEERSYINEHQDTIFLVGYFPTAVERRFCDKLCKKIEKDTSLKLRIYDDSWNNTLQLLEMGKLPIVMNMNRTEKREAYTLFTKPLTPIACGIYSGHINTINSFEAINGKVIGTEKETALSESFPNEYPSLGYTLRVFDTFEQTRKSFEAGEIDGFLSTKSYDDHVKGLNFFKIDSITSDTNHVGISKAYPLLYSILFKEIKLLKEQRWDMAVSDVINYELEKEIVNFSKGELSYLEDTPQIKVGLPVEYFLYAYGDTYNPKGAIPKILDKMEFISGIQLIYEFDTLENLRLREDINVYIDYKTSKSFYSESIFDDEIVIVGPFGQGSINEVFELSMYNVGIFGVPNAHEFLKQKMPNIELAEFKELSDVIGALDENRIDYIVMPRQYLEVVHKKHSIYGEFDINTNRFVSNDNQLVGIIDKCLFILDTEKIVEETLIHNKGSGITWKVALFLLSLLLIGVVFIRGGQWIFRLYYINNLYGLKNLSYLKKLYTRLPKQWVLIELKELEIIGLHYGQKYLNRYCHKIIRDIQNNIGKGEYIFYLHDNKFLITLNRDVSNFLSFLNGVEMLSTNRESLKYNFCICAYVVGAEEELSQVLNKMDIGLLIALKGDGISHLTDELYMKYKSKVSRDIMLTEAISKNKIKLNAHEIVDIRNEHLGKYIDVEIVGQHDLYNRAECLGVDIMLDKYVLSSVLNTTYKANVFVRVSQATLLSDNFINWLKERIKDDTIIYLLIDNNALDAIEDILTRHVNIRFAINNFGRDFMKDQQIKYYEIDYLFVEKRLFTESEEHQDLLSCISAFAKKHHKKLIGFGQSDSSVTYYVRRRADEYFNR